VVNQWRYQMFRRLSPLCVCCLQQSIESVRHYMFECPRTATIWRYAQTLLFATQGTPTENGYWLSFTFQQCIFGSQLPRRVKGDKHLWSLIRGTTVWITWMGRNAICFSTDYWPVEKIETMLWSTLLDTSRMAWLRTKLLTQQQPQRQHRFLEQFDRDWYTINYFGI
jgi:hypothetical protein